jgi:hypothetical protein
MLENAVAAIDDLRQVKNNADLEKTRTKRSLTYDEYSSLLLSAAVAYDAKFTTKKTKHQVFSHEVYDHDDPDDSYDNMESFDIETPVSTLQAYAAMQKQMKSFTKFDQKPRMSKDKWYSLGEDERKIWDQLSDKAKSIILGLDGSQPKGDKKSANLHEISAHEFLQAYVHDVNQFSEQSEEQNDVKETNDNDDQSDSILVNAAKSSKSKLPPGDIRRVMSKSSTRSVNMAKLVYDVSSTRTSTVKDLSLVDRGANGGIAGNDVRVISKTNRVVDVRGIDNHQLVDIDIGTVGGVVTTQKGPVIAIMHQYALFGKDSSIHSPGQFEHFKHEVNDKSFHVGGSQCIKTFDGYVIPLIIKDGLVCLKIRPYTDREFDTLPHVFLTSEQHWDPSVLDHNIMDNEQWFDAIEGVPKDPNSNRFDEFGNYKHCVTVQYAAYFHRHSSNDIEDVIDQCVYDAQYSQVTSDEPNIFYDAHEHLIDDHEEFDPDTFHVQLDPRKLNHKPPDYSLLRPFFGWLSPDIIKDTFQHTTQSNLALNVTRRNEAVACDIVYSDVPVDPLLLLSSLDWTPK